MRSVSDFEIRRKVRKHAQSWCVFAVVSATVLPISLGDAQAVEVTQIKKDKLHAKVAQKIDSLNGQTQKHKEVVSELASIVDEYQQNVQTIKQHKKSKTSVLQDVSDDGVLADDAVESQASELSVSRLRTTNRLHQIIDDVTENTHLDDDSVGQLDTLTHLKDAVAEDKYLKSTQKQRVNKWLDMFKNDVTQQEAQLQKTLAQAKDKNRTVRNILRKIVHQDDVLHVQSQIKIKDQTDKSIAKQIMKQVNTLKHLTGDDVLKRFLTPKSDRENWLRRILEQRYNPEEAKKRAQQLVSKYDTPSELLSALKKAYRPNRHVSSDDIVASLLDKAKNKQQFIAAVLGQHLNTDQAQLLAKTVSQKASTAQNQWHSVQQQLKGHVNHFMQVDQLITSMAMKPSSSVINQQHHWMGVSGFIPSLSNTVLQNKAYFNHQNHTHQMLNPLYFIQPEKQQGAFLGELFDHDGNFQLPSTGVAVKYALYGVGIILLIIGTIVIALRRKHI